MELMDVEVVVSTRRENRDVLYDYDEIPGGVITSDDMEF